MMKKTLFQKTILGLFIIVMVGSFFRAARVEADVPSVCSGWYTTSNVDDCASQATAEALRIRDAINSDSSTEDISQAINEINKIDQGLFSFIERLAIFDNTSRLKLQTARNTVGGYALELKEERNELAPRVGEQEVIDQERAAMAASSGMFMAGESCGLTDILCWIRSVISYIGQFFIEIFGVGLWLVGQAFDLSVKISITNLATYADSPGVTAAWTTLRDLANVFFIFILLYIAIGMILQLKNIDGRRMLVSVIIVALLINFSAFFARVVIDASNVVAVQFFNAISRSETTRILSLESLEIGGISATFMNALPIAKAIANNGGTFINTTAIAFGNVIMILVAIFVFLTATILFVIRTVTLIMLIILSPLAFLMYAFPNQEGLFKKWWSTLFNQAFFAPLYLIMVFVTVKILQSNSLEIILNTGQNAGLTISLHFMITIGFMFGAIIIAKSMGAAGTSAAMKGAGALTNATTGLVSWGTKKGLSGAWAMRNKEGREAAKESRKTFYGKVGATFKDFKTAPLKTTVKGVRDIVGSAEKNLPGGKVAREFIRSPLKTTFEGLAAVTKDQGVGSVLGRTKDEERERIKKDKEEKEENRKVEIKEFSQLLKALTALEKTDPKQAAINAAKTLDKMKSKEIAGLDKSILGLSSVIANLSSEDLKTMNREGVKREVLEKIYNEVSKDKEHQAYKYVIANPTRQMIMEWRSASSAGTGGPAPSPTQTTEPPQPATEKPENPESET